MAGCPEVEGTRQGAHSGHHQRTTWKLPETVTALRCKVGKQKQLDDRAGRPGRALGTHRAAVPSPAAPVSWASTTLGPCTPEPRTEVSGKRRVPGPARQLPGLTSWLCVSERLVTIPSRLSGQKSHQLPQQGVLRRGRTSQALADPQGSLLGTTPPSTSGDSSSWLRSCLLHRYNLSPAPAKPVRCCPS